MSDLLQVQGLSKRFVSRGRSVEAVRDFNLRLATGEMLALVGESGSGKSTILRMLASLEEPDRGVMMLKGHPLGSKRSREDLRLIQMIFQDAPSSFHPRRRVGDSLRDYVRNLKGHSANFCMADLAAAVGLTPDLAERYPRELSGGQCQRWAIARALAVEPELLLCDEITSALDVSSQAQILQLLKHLCKIHGMALLFVSHDLALVSNLCERILVLQAGRLVEEAETANLLQKPRNPYTKQLLQAVLEVRDDLADD